MSLNVSRKAHEPADLDKQLEALRGCGARGQGAQPPCSLDAVWSAVEHETTATRRGPLTRLRELKTHVRILLAVGFAFGVAAAFLLLTGYRTDLSAQTIIRYAVLMVGLFSLNALVFSVALRGPHEPPVRWKSTVVIGLGLLVPVVLSLLPELWLDPELPAEPEIFLCVIPGVLTGLVVATLVWLLQRSTAPLWGRLLSVMVGGGITGFAMLQLHCPARDAEHLLIGHASVGVAMVILTGLLLGLRRIWKR
jgi:hypothetical protein